MKKTKNNVLIVDELENKKNIRENNHMKNLKIEATGTNIGKKESRIIKSVNSKRNNNNLALEKPGSKINNFNNDNIQSIKKLNSDISKGENDGFNQEETCKEPKNDCKQNNKNMKGRSSSFSQKVK